MKDLGDEDTVPCLGIIGLDVVSRFRVFFDYSHDTVAFKPYSR